MKLHTRDTVVVITGKDKGKTGEILRILENKGRVVVAGINMRTKHVRKTPQNAGQILKYEASINASNIMLLDPKTKKRTRIGYREEKGKKVRFAKRSGEIVTVVKKPMDDPTKEGKDKKDEKEVKKKTVSKTSAKKAKEMKVEKPAKKPFWKSLGFGAEATEDQGDDRAREGKDHSVPDQGQAPDVRTSQRGS